MTTWHYNLDKFANGPFKVEMTAPVIKETWENKTLKNLKRNVSILILLTTSGLGTVELNNWASFNRHLKIETSVNIMRIIRRYQG